jgi:hypothetical protein
MPRPTPGLAREDQDRANAQSLLLLISRGYWSTDFLKAVTAAYWDFDHSQGGNAWPLPQRAGAMYAVAPGGKYLADGILALTAALTANPVASAWAFTAFQPGTEAIEGSGQQVGKFTHYLFFEHRFSSGSSTDDGIGMTAALTALSAAIDVLKPPTPVRSTMRSFSAMSRRISATTADARGTPATTGTASSLLHSRYGTSPKRLSSGSRRRGVSA